MKMTRPLLLMTVTRLLRDNGYLSEKEFELEKSETVKKGALAWVLFNLYRWLIAVPVVLIVRVLPFTLPLVHKIARKVWIDYAIRKAIKKQR